MTSISMSKSPKRNPADGDEGVEAEEGSEEDDFVFVLGDPTATAVIAKCAGGVL